MQAYVTPQIWNGLGGNINAGSVYVITNFHVAPVRGIYRHVHSSECIHFIPSTTVVFDAQDDFVIPMHKFECIPLGELFSNRMLYDDDGEPPYSTGKNLNF